MRRNVHHIVQIQTPKRLGTVKLGTFIGEVFQVFENDAQASKDFVQQRVCISFHFM